jgi:hypothetical protein
MGSFLRRVVLYSRIPVGIIALAGLLLSGLVHVASIRGIDIESAWPSGWILHYALFPIIALVVIAAGVVAGQKRLGFRAFLALVPAPAWIVLAAAFFYAVATFARREAGRRIDDALKSRAGVPPQQPSFHPR